VSKVMHTIYLAIIAVLGAALIWPKFEMDSSVHVAPIIAVLQFVSVDSSNSSTSTASGLTSDLIQFFSDNDEMDVVPKHNIDAAFDRSLTLADIGDKLSATAILEGAVSESNDRMRITVQLIDVETENHLWSQTYDRQLGDTDGLVVDIGRAVTGQLSR
jgi:adenylate cyclase